MVSMISHSFNKLPENYGRKVFPARYYVFKDFPFIFQMEECLNKYKTKLNHSQLKTFENNVQQSEKLLLVKLVSSK